MIELDMMELTLSTTETGYSDSSTIIVFGIILKKNIYTLIFHRGFSS